MKRLLLAASAALIALTAAMAPALAAANPFVGAWEGIDLDGSHMTLAISGGSRGVRLVLFDSHASLCVNNGAPAAKIAVQGSGTVSGNTLTFSFGDLRCPGGIMFAADPSAPPGTLTYVPASDTIEWQQAEGFPLTIWYRIPSDSA